MASRINTRFVLIIFIVGGVAAGLVGGLWYVKVRTDLTRSLKRADEYVALGDFRKARIYYARAVGKEPGNLQYLHSLEESLLQIQPTTTDEAREMYAAYISVLRHAAVHHPADAEMHLRVLEELHRVSRLTSSAGYTDLMAEAADEMWERVPAANPDRSRARLYRGAARVSPWMRDRLNEEEIQAGVTDLEEFLQVFPDNDLGWATLIQAHYTTMLRLQEAGQLTRAQESMAQLRETILRARTAVPDGPEVVTMSLLVALNDYEVDRTLVDVGACAADAARLPDLVRGQDDAWLYAQASLTLQRLYWVPDRPSGIDLIGSYTEAHPDAYDIQMFKARIHYMRGEIDEAEETARRIIDSEPMPVGFVAQVQQNLRREAQSLCVDVAVGRLQDEEVDRDSQLLKIEEARDALAALVTDPDNDPLLIRARGQVAFLQRDYAEAAALFNRLVMSGEGDDFQTRVFAAMAMEQQGEIGAAVQLLDEAIKEQPGNTSVLMRQARLRLRMGHYEESNELVAKVLMLEPDHADALSVRQRLAERLAPDDSGEETRVRRALDKASTAFASGEYESARSTLLVALETAPDNLLLLNGLIRIEMTAGQPEAARQYLDRALAIVPNNSTFLAYKNNLDNPDRIQAVKEYMKDVYEDETRRAVETLVTMAALVLQADEAAAEYEGNGQFEEARESRERARRAQLEEDAFRAKVEQIAPQNPRFVEYRFVKAIMAQDWEEAERVMDLAAELNVDKAGGTMLRGRYHIARDEFEDAILSLRETVDRIPYSAMAWRLMAIAYRELGNFPDALNAFAASYDNNPNDIDTVLEYAQLLYRTGNLTRALLVVRNGRRLAPGNVVLRNVWLQIEGEAGDRAIGLRERRRVYDENPGDRANAVALAKILGGTEPTRELLLDDDGKELYSLERWNRLPAAGSRSQKEVLARVKSAWNAEADRILDELMPEGERDLQWHVLRASVLREQGNASEGIELLRSFADAQPDGEKKLQALLALGVYEGQTGRFGESKATLTEARDHQGPDGHLADLALGEMMYRLGQYEQGMKHLEVVNERRPDRQTELMVIDSLVKLGRFPEARARLDAIGDDRDARTSMIRATLLLEEGKKLWQAGETSQAETAYQEHLEWLTKAAQISPTEPMPHILKATGMLARFRQTGDRILLEDAMLELDRAEEIRIDVAEASIARIDVLEARGDDRGALAELTRLVNRSPRQDAARKRLADALIDQRRYDAAIEVVAEGVELSPTAVRWRALLGDLYVAAQRKAQSELRSMEPGDRGITAKKAEIARYRGLADEQYAAALEISSDARLVQKRAEAMLASDPPRVDDAIELIEEYESEVENSPTLRAAYARALAGADRREEANEHLRQSYLEIRELIDAGKQPPDIINAWFMSVAQVFERDGAGPAAQFVTEMTGGTLDSYESYYLATLWRMAGRDGLSRTIELFRKATEDFPPNDKAHEIRVWSELGIALIITKQHQAAFDALMKVLEIDPDNVDVLNNVGFVLSEALDRPQEALAYAQRADELRPDYEPVLDTLGWIYFQLGKDDLADRYIRRAVQAMPTAVNQLHMASILVRSGNDKMALRYLTKAMELKPDADTEEEINELADDIRTRNDQDQ